MNQPVVYSRPFRFCQPCILWLDCGEIPGDGETCCCQPFPRKANAGVCTAIFSAPEGFRSHKSFSFRGWRLVGVKTAGAGIHSYRNLDRNN